MKKVLLFIAPLLIVIFICISIFLFLEQSAKKGALQVTSNPKSKVYLDGKLVGNTTLCLCKKKEMLKAGAYKIKLVPDGSLKLFEEKININRDTLTVVDRTFHKDYSEGSIIELSSLRNKKDVEIFVRSSPMNANVFLDDKPMGITPLLLENVDSKDYNIRVSKNGYKDKAIRVKTTSGYKLSSMIYLGINSPLPEPKVEKVLILDTPTGFLRVRTDSSISSSEIAQVLPGQAFELLEEKNEWFKIKMSNGSSGWISSEYAEKQ